MVDPRAYSQKAALKNGVEVTIRALRPDDRERMAAAFRGLDRESIYTRFFGYRELTEAGLDRAMRFDPEREVVLVVTLKADDVETVIGGGRYIAIGDGVPRSAEVAFTIEEDYHGLGIAGRLLAILAEIAREKGYVAFEADVLKENKAMLGVFERSGLAMSRRLEGDSVHVTLKL
jgi:RimJ/RimL family protein N-acetyltransferase